MRGLWQGKCQTHIIFNFILAEVFQLKLLPYFIVLTFLEYKRLTFIRLSWNLGEELQLLEEEDKKPMNEVPASLIKALLLVLRGAQRTSDGGICCHDFKLFNIHYFVSNVTSNIYRLAMHLV